MIRVPLPAVIALIALATPLRVAAQTPPCQTNLVANPGFENLLLNLWQVAGPGSVAFATGSVDGLTSSRYIVIPANGAYSITQPTPVTLTSGELYELAWDVYHSSCCFGRAYSADLVDTASGSIAMTLITGDVGRVGRSTPTVRFTPPQTGSFQIRINIANERDNVLIDNVRIRPNATLFRFDGLRAVGVSDSYTVIGPPNEYFAVLMTGVGLLPSPIAISPCYGGWWLALSPLPLELAFSSFSAQGTFTASVTVPSGLSGVPIYFQPIVLPPNCGFGCPQTYGFF